MTSITCISTLPAYSQSENLLERFGLYCQLLGHECYRFQFCAWISSLCSTSLRARGQKRFTGPMTCKGARQISFDTHPGVQCRSLGANGQTSQDRRWFRGDMISVYLSGCIFVWPMVSDHTILLFAHQSHWIHFVKKYFDVNILAFALRPWLNLFILTSN